MHSPKTFSNFDKLVYFYINFTNGLVMVMCRKEWKIGKLYLKRKQKILISDVPIKITILKKYAKLNEEIENFKGKREAQN